MKQVIAIKRAAALTLAGLALSAASAYSAGNNGSASGNSRPIMPGGQPAGTGLQQQTPGSSMGPQGLKPAPAPSPSPPTAVPSPSRPVSPGQGTVKGSTGAPASSGLPAGGTAGSRGGKDGALGH